MTTTTPIQWTDQSWNPVRGCSRVSTGCEHCYAERIAWRYRQKRCPECDGGGTRYAVAGSGHVEAQVRWCGNCGGTGKVPGPFHDLVRNVGGRPTWNGSIRLVPEVLGDPLRRRAPTRYFVNSMSDLFHEHIPFDYIAAVFGYMAACPDHVFQVLTKRPERARAFFHYVEAKDLHDDPRGECTAGRLHCCDRALVEESQQIVGDAGPLHTKRAADPAGAWPLPNVWIGVSAENQATLDERAAILATIPAAVRWWSLEPLLERVAFDDAQAPDWIVVGGESGPGARPCDVRWIGDVVAIAAAASIPVFVKQIGANAYISDASRPGVAMPLRTRDRKGGDPAEWFLDIRVRDWPDPPRAFELERARYWSGPDAAKR